MHQNLRNSFALAFLSIFVLVTACAEKVEHPEPLYDSKDVHDPLTFGPGMHTKIVVYKNVVGWVKNKEPEWVSCQSLRLDYRKLIDNYYRINGDNFKIYTFAGDTWMSSFIKFGELKGTVFEVTEWDDHSNYQETKREDLVKTICQAN